MMNKREIERWLSTLPEDAEIAIDEGGLTLIDVDGDAYCEVGGVPEEESGDYLVTWKIEVDAENHRSAAEEALAIQRDPHSMESKHLTTPDQILGINQRTYNAPGWVEVPIIVVLVSGSIGDYAAYISGGSDPDWCRRHGNKLKFEEAQIHFCNCLEREKYRD